MTQIRGDLPRLEREVCDSNQFKPGRKISLDEGDGEGFVSLLHQPDAFIPGLERAPDTGMQAQRNPFASPLKKLS